VILRFPSGRPCAPMTTTLAQDTSARSASLAQRIGACQIKGLLVKRAGLIVGTVQVSRGLQGAAGSRSPSALRSSLATRVLRASGRGTVRINWV